MAKEELELSIDAAGRVTVRTIGVKGPRCLDNADTVAQILGRVESRELTNEYYEAQESGQAQIDVTHSG